MKGVILAGGLGTRLRPLTDVTNKHLLPVYDKPMIYYPIETLVAAGIDDILIVTGENHIDAFYDLLGSGEDFGVNIELTWQRGEGGIAEALTLAKDFVGREAFAVILGDNLFEDITSDLATALKNAITYNEPCLFIKEVEDPERFGVAEADETANGHFFKINHIEEKPLHPKSNYAVTGLYVYPPQVFDILPTLKRSPRGELEITDVNNILIEQYRSMPGRKMNALRVRGYWQDAGTFNSLFVASMLKAQKNVHVKHSKKFQNLIKAIQNESYQTTNRA